MEETSSAAADYTADDLSQLTIAQIKALAEDCGYTITKTKKADIIEEFLNQQEGG